MFKARIPSASPRSGPGPSTCCLAPWQTPVGAVRPGVVTIVLYNEGAATARSPASFVPVLAFEGVVAPWLLQTSHWCGTESWVWSFKKRAGGSTGVSETNLRSPSPEVVKGGGRLIKDIFPPPLGRRENDHGFESDYFFCVTEVGVEKALLTFCVRFRSKEGGGEMRQ